LRLGNEYFKHTGKTDFLTERWFVALATLMQVLEEQSQGTFNETSGKYMGNIYTFQRNTNTGTETLSLKGVGNPIRGGTGLIRSAFRPSDDATILPFFIPANAMMAVELKRAAAMLKQAGKDEVAEALLERGTSIEQGIAEHAVVKHKSFGDVYAFEVDGFGSHILMDDANLPSLLSLPLLGFVDASDPVYQNTRRMILSKQGNPYFLKGSAMKGIGGPHVGLQHSWPMSLLVQAMTSDDDAEILDCLLAVRNSSKLGLVHESVHVDLINDYTSMYSDLYL
jgi:meiotically up-regulated gene 157 (Mug157) protein